MSRTDLAVEAHSKIKGKGKEIHGVTVTSDEWEAGIVVTTVSIETENAAKIMERPKGNYVTIDFSGAMVKSQEYESAVVGVLTKLLQKWITAFDKKDGFSVGHQGEADISVLVAGLGNPEEVIDALGPKVVKKISKSRHIMKEFGKYTYGSAEVSRISGIAPGIRESTGMEAQEIIRGIVSETTQDFLITVDALVGKSPKRIGKTIQLTDSGIVPGSGVGMHRMIINKNTIGIPVISIGVPMVMDVSYGFFLIPKDITQKVEQLSRMIAHAVENAFHE